MDISSRRVCVMRWVDVHDALPSYALTIGHYVRAAVWYIYFLLGLPTYLRESGFTIEMFEVINA